MLERMCNFEPRTNEYTCLLKVGQQRETPRKGTPSDGGKLWGRWRGQHGPLLFGGERRCREKRDSAGRRGVRCQEGERMGWGASGGPERQPCLSAHSAP